MGSVTVERLAEVMVEIADTLVDDFDLMALFYSLTRHAAELLDASEVGLIAIDAGGELEFVAASHQRAQTLELFQLQAREGPCLDTFHTGIAVTNVQLVGATERWPEFAPRAVAAGLAVVHALPMHLRHEVVGCLNVFTGAGRVVSASELAIVQALADVATISMLQERALERATVLTEQLQRALSSRVVIEQAKGALAQIHGKDADAAFEILRGYARRHHHKLTDLAQACLAHPEQFPDLMRAPSGER
jgi:GAF domain-containing protein